MVHFRAANRFREFALVSSVVVALGSLDGACATAEETGDAMLTTGTSSGASAGSQGDTGGASGSATGGSSGANGAGTGGTNGGAGGAAGTSGAGASGGASGTSGSAGSSGASGSAGSSGASGSAGSSGASGSAGSSGAGGSAGSSGTGGASGNAGAGTGGASGTGTGGASGTGGTAGASGASGTGGSAGANGSGSDAGASGRGGSTSASDAGPGGRLFLDDFEDGNMTTPSWIDADPTLGAMWAVTADTAGGKLLSESVVPTKSDWVINVSGDYRWTNQVVSARVKFTSAPGMVGVFARFMNTENYYFVYLDGSNIVLRGRINNSSKTITKVKHAAVVNTWYTLKLSVVGDTLTGYVDDMMLVTGADATIKSGGIGVGVSEASGQFDNVTVTQP